MSKLITVLLSIAIPGQLCATAISLSKFQRPNGTNIILVGDVHVATKCENQQKQDLIEHLRDKKNALLVAEDPLSAGYSKDQIDGDTTFLPGLVEHAKNNGIDAISIEFRNEASMEYYHALLEKCASLKNDIAALGNDAIKSDFDALQASLISIEDKVRYFASIPENIDLSPADTEAYEALMDQGHDLETAMFDYVYLVHITNASIQEKDTYVCVGNCHATTLAKQFTMLGYTQLFERSSYTSTNTAAFMPYEPETDCTDNDDENDSCGTDCSQDCDDANQDEEASLEDKRDTLLFMSTYFPELLNHYVLNLADALKAADQKN